MHETAEIEWLEPSPLGSIDHHSVVVQFGQDEPAEARPPSARSLAAAKWRGRWRDRYRRWHQLTVSAPSPRVDSVVRRVLRCDPDQALVMVEQRLASVPGLALEGPLSDRGHTSLQRAPGRLCIPFCRPRVPIWLAVEPWWRDQTLVTLSLRTSRRWRYPLRYFGTAHTVLDQLTRIESIKGSSAAGA
ncbi:MAG: hypothetical protein ACR2QE_12875 [Acidimicrobiales bacterium]